MAISSNPLSSTGKGSGTSRAAVNYQSSQTAPPERATAKLLLSRRCKRSHRFARQTPNSASARCPLHHHQHCHKLRLDADGSIDPHVSEFDLFRRLDCDRRLPRTPGVGNLLLSQVMHEPNYLNHSDHDRVARGSWGPSMRQAACPFGTS
jgi:hypothetical protein